VIARLEGYGTAMRQTSWFSFGFTTAQWFIFLLANALSLPIVIGQIYHLPPEEVAGLMQRTFFVIGLTSFLQGWLGHRFPLSDGPAGIWLGIFVIMGELAANTGQQPEEVLRVMVGGMIVAGLLILFLAGLRLIPKMLGIFTPLVTGSFLMLLAIQLSGVFLRGMMDIRTASGTVRWDLVGVSLVVFALVLCFTTWGKGWMRSYAVLIGIVVGWVGFTALGYQSNSFTHSGFFTLPEFLAWGGPIFEPGMAVSAIVVALILLSNLIASTNAMQQVLTGETKVAPSVLTRAGVWSGVATILSALFSTVGMVPLTVAAGFVEMTGQKRRGPFLTACLALAGVALIPMVIGFLSKLPGPIAYAALLASFGQMFGLGLHSVLKEPLDPRRTRILGLTLSLGAGMMFLPASLFLSMPSVLQSFFSNGLLVGTVICILFEQLWPPNRSKWAKN
jgi:xanthine/uracil permease